MGEMNVDGIALIAVGINQAKIDKQMRHIDGVLTQQGFTVVPYGSEDWSEIVISVAGSILGPGEEEPQEQEEES